MVLLQNNVDAQLRAPQPSAPANDNCNNAIVLTPHRTCQTTPGNTQNANNSPNSVPNPTNCGGTPGKDVWFQQQVPSSGVVSIKTFAGGGGGMTNGAIALYSGTCSNLNLIACADSGSLMPFITVSNLNPGTNVYIRVWGEGNNSDGDFTICSLLQPCDLDCTSQIGFTNGTYNNSNSTLELCNGSNLSLFFNSSCLSGVRDSSFQWQISTNGGTTFTNLNIIHDEFTRDGTIQCPGL